VVRYRPTHPLVSWFWSFTMRPMRARQTDSSLVRRKRPRESNGRRAHPLNRARTVAGASPAESPYLRGRAYRKRKEGCSLEFPTGSHLRRRGRLQGPTGRALASRRISGRDLRGLQRPGRRRSPPRTPARSTTDADRPGSHWLLRAASGHVGRLRIGGGGREPEAGSRLRQGHGSLV
jgi:hypothetical protein